MISLPAGSHIEPDIRSETLKIAAPQWPWLRMARPTRAMPSLLETAALLVLTSVIGVVLYFDARNSKSQMKNFNISDEYSLISRI
jgi:hypothetical protein